jgi:hypothetical protein
MTAAIANASRTSRLSDRRFMIAPCQPFYGRHDAVSEFGL